MRVGWIGVGNMGKPMAGHVLEAGHELTVHDLRREAATDLLEAGATWADSPAQAAQGKDVVFTSLPMPQDVEMVATGQGGILEGIPPGAIYADLSTNSLATVRKLHRVFQERGMTFLDAPVSGGVKGAMSRDMIVMVGGDQAAYQRIKPVLDAMGDKVTYCGPIGSGTVCKLCHQLLSAGLTQLVSEVLTLGLKAGVPLATLADAISKSASGKKPPLAGWEEGTFLGKFEGTPLSFYLELMRKDVRLACEMGRDMGVPLELGSLVEQRLIEAMNRGWGRMNNNVVVRLQEEKAGVEIRLR